MNGQKHAVSMAATSAASSHLRWLGFGLYMTAAMVLYFVPLRELARLAQRIELYSHVPLIPFVTLFFLAAERQRIFVQPMRSLRAGLPLTASGLALFGYIAFLNGAAALVEQPTLVVASLWLVTVGGFVTFFGLRVARDALFPLAFLAFAIPPPQALVDRVVAFLLRGSAALTELFLQVLGVTFLREGPVFQLGRVTIEIAKECSGIRSSLALFITMTLAAWMFLRRWWSRTLLLLAVIPLAMVKNAIRIVTLTLLAEYVDMGFLTGRLHHGGGFVFFGITLTLFGGVLLALRRLEQGSRGGVAARAPAPRGATAGD